MKLIGISVVEFHDDLLPQNRHYPASFKGQSLGKGTGLIRDHAFCSRRDTSLVFNNKITIKSVFNATLEVIWYLYSHKETCSPLGLAARTSSLEL